MSAYWLFENIEVTDEKTTPVGDAECPALHDERGTAFRFYMRGEAPVLYTRDIGRDQAGASHDRAEAPTAACVRFLGALETCEVTS